DPRPKLCFLSTASADSLHYERKFFTAFSFDKCRPSCLRLLRRPAPDPVELLEDQDVIYVGGGWTVPMLNVWRARGIDACLRRVWEHGTVLCGVSAGSMCWFESGVTAAADRPNALAPLLNGLGFLAGSHCPHYDDDHRRQSYHDMLAAGELEAGHAAEGG